MRSDALSRLYMDHNLRRGRGFIYGGVDRVGRLRAAIGPISTYDHILDLGCRDGSLASALGLPPSRTVGVDIDAEALMTVLAERRASACQANLWQPLPFRDAAFGLVVAGEIVEHVPFPDHLVAEIARVLRRGGKLVGSVPNAFRLQNRMMFMLGRWFEKDPTHLRHFSVTALQRLLEHHFSGVEILPCVGRLTWVSPRMFANDLVWAATKRW